MVFGLCVTPNGSSSYCELEDVSDVGASVIGYPVQVDLARPDAVAWLDEEGQASSRPINYFAARIMSTLRGGASIATGDQPCGNVLFLGCDQTTGDIADVPQDIIALAQRLHQAAIPSMSSWQDLPGTVPSTKKQK